MREIKSMTVSALIKGYRKQLAAFGLRDKCFKEHRIKNPLAKQEDPIIGHNKNKDEG